MYKQRDRKEIPIPVWALGFFSLNFLIATKYDEEHFFFNVKCTNYSRGSFPDLITINSGHRHPKPKHARNSFQEQNQIRKTPLFKNNVTATAKE